MLAASEEARLAAAAAVAPLGEEETVVGWVASTVSEEGSVALAGLGVAREGPYTSQWLPTDPRSRRSCRQ